MHLVNYLLAADVVPMWCICQCVTDVQSDADRISQTAYHTGLAPMKSSLRIPPHLTRVVVLPCEIFVSLYICWFLGTEGYVQSDADRISRDRLKKLEAILSGDTTIALHLQFLIRTNKADLQILKNTKVPSLPTFLRSTDKW